MPDTPSLPMPAPNRIPITDLKHRTHVGSFFGAIKAEDALKKAPESLRRLPGFAAALAVVEALVANEKVKTFALNQSAAAKAGIDLSRYYVHSCDFDSIYIKPEEDIGAEAGSDS